MKVVTASEEVFACYHAACAPPPVGKGGSSKGGRAGAGKDLARSLTSKYGSRKAGGSGRSSGGGGSSSTTKSAARQAADRWASGSRSGSKAPDARSSDAIYQMTKRFGGRTRGAQGRKIKSDSVENPRTPDSVMDMTRRFGGRSRGR